MSLSTRKAVVLPDVEIVKYDALLLEPTETRHELKACFPF